MNEVNNINKGNFNLISRSLHENEKKFYGIFISHSNKDNKILEEIKNAMQEKGIYSLCDRDILAGGDDFQVKIEKALDCYGAVVIITEDSLKSSWCQYEIGFLSGHNIPIYLYDPFNLLNSNKKTARVKNTEFLNSHINKYMPAINSLDVLVENLSTLNPYSEMFSEENDFLTCEEFKERIAKHVETAIVEISSDIFEKYSADFKECHFRTLVVNFGMFKKAETDGAHCLGCGQKIKNEIDPLEENEKHCELLLSDTLDESNKECVLLNYVLENGTLYTKGEKDNLGNIVEKAKVVYNVPVHNTFGTVFKFILDIEDSSRYFRLMNILEEAGFNPTASSSYIDGRIYLSLPSRHQQGFARMKTSFNNNFLCPYSVRKK